MSARIFILLGLLAASCATTPKGEKELMAKIEADRTLQGKQDSISQGRPLFLEVAAYPQFLPGGDIWTGGVILLKVGREELQFKELIEQYKGKKP